MRLKIIMSSGKEYVCTKYSSVEELIHSSSESSLKINFTSLDDETIFINGEHISSIEVLGE
jgi:uncharacterized protein YlzI (FlbEa/FlbD family)